MSVSLAIDWPNGESEEVPIGSLRQAEGWAEDAQALGLELVPQFYCFIPVDSENLDQLIREVQAFREAMAARGSDYDERVQRADKLLEAFQRLRRSAGWTASIG